MDPAVVEQLVAEMGLSELDTEQREQLIASLGDLLETRLSEVLANRMDDAQFTEFEKLATAGDANAVLNYIRMIVPDYDQLLRAEMDKIKVEFGAEAAELISSMDEYKQASAALAQADEQLSVANQSDAAQPGSAPTQPVAEPASAPQAMPLKVPQIDTNPAPAAPPPFPPPGPTPQTVPTTENPSTPSPIPPNDFV